MNFDPSEEQTMLADMADKLFGAHAERDMRDAEAEWRDSLVYGLIGLPFPERQGGLGGGHEETMLVMEAIGRHLAHAPFLQSVLMAGRVLAMAERAELTGLLDGGFRSALCLFEAGQRYGWEKPITRAERTRDGWVLDGTKLAVLDLDRKCALIVPASVPEGLGLFLVPPGTGGVSLDVRPTPDGRTAANVVLDQVVLPAGAAIGDPSRNAHILSEVVDGAILASCAESLGAMERLLELTVDYLNVREQFGAIIGTFQALQHRAADMLIAIDRARSMTIYAASMMDAASDQRTSAVAAARAMVNQSSRFVGQQAIQLHGGMGLASECAAGAYFQRLTVLETMFGDTDHLLTVVERCGGLAAD